MFNVLTNIVILLYFILNIQLSNAAIHIVSPSNKSQIDYFNEILSKRIAKHDIKPYSGNIVINNDFKIKNKINDNLKIFSHFNSNINCNIIENKNYFVALSKLNLGYFEIINDKYGSISYGKNYGVMKNVTKLSNVTPVFKNDYNDYDHFMLNKSNNLVSYKNNDFFGLIKGLKIDIQYQGVNNTNYINNHRKLIQCGTGHGYGASASYNYKNFDIAAAYFRSKRTYDQAKLDTPDVSILLNNNRHASSYAGICKYSKDNIHLSALYGISKFVLPYGRIDNSYILKLYDEESILRRNFYCGYVPKAKTLELVSKYKFKCGIEPHAAFVNTFCGLLKNNDEYLNKFISLGLTYKPNNNFLTFIDYKINLIENNNFCIESKIKADNAMAFGFKFKF